LSLRGTAPARRLAALAIALAPAAGVGGCFSLEAGVNEDAGPSLTCGPGTIERDRECVPAASGTAGAVPAITAVEPASDLLGGGGVFTIRGSGFLAPDAGETVLSFGDATAEAFLIVSDALIQGIVPPGTAREATLTVANDNGADSVPFEYVGLYVADGKGGVPGNLYLVDPRGKARVTIGPIQSQGPDDGEPIGHAVSGLAFAPDGTLYAAEVTRRQQEASLLVVDPATGAATVVGPLDETREEVVDEEVVLVTINHAAIADLTFQGTTLIGWTEPGQDDPVSIDTATGAVTVLGSSGIGTFGSGMATLPDGTVVIAGNSVSGSLHAVDTTDGSTTVLVSLAGGSSDTRPNGMTLFRGTLYAVLNGDYGGAAISALATIDPVTGAVAVLGVVPGGVDALASDLPGLASSARFSPGRGDVQLERMLAESPCAVGRRGRVELVSGRARASLAARDLGAHPAARPLSTRRANQPALALAAIEELAGAREVEVIACGGDSLRLAGAELGPAGSGYRLVSNRRGRPKLVAPDGETLLRNLVELRAVP
jgi:hypothetical protein